jgi:F0F1-type ATP synthase beta subunit
MIEMVYSNTVNMLTRNNYSANVLLQVDNIYMFVKDWIVKG